MNIKETFNELINTPKSSSQYNTKLYDYNDSNNYKTLLAVDTFSDYQKCVLLQLKNGGKESEIIIKNINILDSIKIDTFPVPNHGKTELDTYYSIKLDKDTEEEIFYAFITDIIEIVKVSKNELIILDTLKRIKAWMLFFKSKKTGVLSENNQIGLFAELTLLKNLLGKNLNNLSSVISSWVGPKKQNQDFIFPNGQAVEVKCTTSNNRFEVKINNEYQLDSTGLESLHLSVSQVKRHKNSKSNTFPTLPSIVNEIKTILRSDYEAKFEFESLLLEVGYLEEVEVEYLDFGFQVLGEPRVYHVNEDFPIISSKTIPNEIKKVEYILNLQNEEIFNGSINDLITI